MEAADLIEELSRAQRRLPCSGSIDIDAMRIKPNAAAFESQSFIRLPLDGEQLP